MSNINNKNGSIETKSFLLKEVDIDLWKSLKIRVIENNSTISETIKGLIYNYINGDNKC